MRSNEYQPAGKLLPLILFLTALLAPVVFYAQKPAGNIVYAQPVFTDPNRLQKIMDAMPVIDQLYKDYAAKNHFPGFAWGIVVDGKLVHTGYLGYDDVDKKTTVNNQSAFRVASMTKSFTAMAILKLRDEGKLRLDDPVYLYIPEMKNQPYPTKDAAPVTIRNLLSHSAGFPEDNPWGDRQLADTDEELLALIKKGISYSNDPGQGYEYSNLGFGMLGYIIKKVSGKSYEQYISENILAPLNMTNTYWEYAKVPPNQLAHGYRWLNNGWVEQPLLHDGTYGAMGGMITTIEDFSKYVAFHLSVWPPGDSKETGPVKRSSVREMHYPWDVNGFNAQYKYPSGRACPVVTAYCYGLGWTRDCDGRLMTAHTGGLPGFGSNWRILPDYGIGAICFANLTYAGTSYINLQVLDTLIAMAVLKPRQLIASSILNERRDGLVKILPAWNNAEATGIFAQNFFMDYFPDSLRKEATAIFDKAGKIISVKEVQPENGLRGWFIMEGQNSNIQVTFTLTPENPPMIQAYSIKEVPKK
jgi:CubicO group peptidase (beta-lactamase class C family)